jgi:hypothetical protein
MSAPNAENLGCGVISVEIDVADNQITWSDFGYENNYEEHVGRDSYSSGGPFDFNRPVFEAMLRINPS